MEILAIVTVILVVVTLPVGAVLFGFWSGLYSHGKWLSRNGYTCLEKKSKSPDWLERATIRGFDKEERRKRK